ncbi:PIN domain protein [Leptospira biflexa serovar Patoc strain 'Patoc 1 (Ames)']|uniref:PIN domain-containing protein n=3 Tax=Leptospira TaxID=171 RepID=A0A4Z1A1G5_9LEPT|nr:MULTISPECIES: PIN domain-containing protein [Leptospira]ABZ95290.1 PIN domain protein [Leptospira biflexa serovar Patoc strain 'Patoc 1 (Ames)']ABZ98981.1 Putative PIN domain protein [Leptospira biflexa serovar Patoc strain 'Patoc 1 (Paris)']EOQ90306.1 PIN domain protein [Leptospira yanagawae serovar Saopaulo str. Sao Paulo = ATCC 700523]TGL56902.1 PIN domain-containing protein [Leptospira jelokensis]TGM31835.1 PIN domain-containing protein [Leptospira biflexa]
MKNVALIDSGPIIALFNEKDKFHKSILKYLKSFKGELISSWPVVTEVIYLLSFSVEAQSDFLEWIERGGIQIFNLSIEDLKYIKSRMKKYSDLPMDLADASLMCIAEKFEYENIISIDSDFSIYKTVKGKFLRNLYHV